mgnify:CR=1 FL=1
MLKLPTNYSDLDKCEYIICNRDDVINESYDEDGFIKFDYSYEKIIDNTQSIFSIDKDNLNVSFDGVSFYNANSLSSNSSGLTISINNCRYIHIVGKMINISSQDGVLSFKDVVFEKNIYCSSVAQDMLSVLYENVLFENNIAPNGLTDFTHIKNLSMTKVVAHDNNYTQFRNNGGHWEIKDCDFYRCLNQFNAGCLALCNLFFGPDAGLHFAHMGFLEEEHAQAALSYTSANRRG